MLIKDIRIYLAVILNLLILIKPQIKIKRISFPVISGFACFLNNVDILSVGFERMSSSIWGLRTGLLEDQAAG